MNKIVDADTSVFIYLFSFLRYKLKRECVATQTRFVIFLYRSCPLSLRKHNEPEMSINTKR